MPLPRGFDAGGEHSMLADSRKRDGRGRCLARRDLRCSASSGSTLLRSARQSIVAAMEVAMKRNQISVPLDPTLHELVEQRLSARIERSPATSVT
jgi:hypothetical protein